MSGHADIVARLLRDERTQIAPTSDMLRMACVYGHKAVVEVLLAVGRIDRASALAAAQARGLESIVQLLLEQR